MAYMNEEKKYNAKNLCNHKRRALRISHCRRNNKQIKEIREQLNELDNLTELARSGTSAEMIPARLEATQEGIAY